MPANLKTTYQSSDQSVLSIDCGGRVHALKPGITKVSACVSNGHAAFFDCYIAAVAQPQAESISLDGAVVTASSCAENRPVSQLLWHNGSIWQSDYRSRALRMPQWIALELPRQTMVSAVLCKAWRGSSRGAILRASVFTSLDGTNYKMVCRRSWSESSVREDRLFPFSPHMVRHIRIDIDWAVMYTGDSNAASIAGLELYYGDLIAAVESFPAKSVRFGTPLAEAMSRLQLPSQVQISLPDGSLDIASVLWDCEDYDSNIPGSYRVVGAIYHERIPNPGNLYAEQILQVRPKDMTAPPDKNRFHQVFTQAQELCRAASNPAVHTMLEPILAQASSFNARTGAVQHDVDIWTDRLEDALASSLRSDRKGKQDEC